MPSYVSNFKKFMKSEESKEVELGANSQMVEEDDASLLTDPDLVKIQDQIRNLEKQLERRHGNRHRRDRKNHPASASWEPCCQGWRDVPGHLLKMCRPLGDI
jgi:hypothetical protein